MPKRMSLVRNGSGHGESLANDGEQGRVGIVAGRDGNGAAGRGAGDLVKGGGGGVGDAKAAAETNVEAKDGGGAAAGRGLLEVVVNLRSHAAARADLHADAIGEHGLRHVGGWLGQRWVCRADNGHAPEAAWVPVERLAGVSCISRRATDHLAGDTL